MSEVLKIGGWILLSSVKYIIAVLALLAKSERLWFLDMAIVAIGGCLGVFVFTFLGSLISKFLERFSIFKVSYKNLRRFVVIKKGYGLIGIAFITPMIIGIPLGCILCTLFEPDKNKVMRFQLASVGFWSVLLFGIKGLIQVFN